MVIGRLHGLHRLNRFTLMGRHIIQSPTQNKRYFSATLRSTLRSPAVLMISFGVACFGASRLYSTIYGSYKDRLIVNTKEELASATTKAIDYYNSGEGHEKYDNWKQKKHQEKQKRKQQKKQKKKENIQEAIKIYKNTKAELKGDK